MIQLLTIDSIAEVLNPANRNSAVIISSASCNSRAVNVGNVSVPKGSASSPNPGQVPACGAGGGGVTPAGGGGGRPPAGIYGSVNSLRANNLSVGNPVDGSIGPRIP